jgi:hypothetical protein
MMFRCLLSVLFLFASEISLGSDLRLEEASSLPLHSIDDYLEWVPIEALDAGARAELTTKGKFSAQDFLTANGRYSLFHKFEGKNASLLNLACAALTADRGTGSSLILALRAAAA